MVESRVKVSVFFLLIFVVFDTFLVLVGLNALSTLALFTQFVELGYKKKELLLKVYLHPFFLFFPAPRYGERRPFERHNGAFPRRSSNLTHRKVLVKSPPNTRGVGGEMEEAADKSRLVKHNYIPVGGESAALKGKRLTWDSCMETSRAVELWR